MEWITEVQAAATPTASHSHWHLSLPLS